MKRKRMAPMLEKLITIRGTRLCYYCDEEIATTVDHVVPFSWDGDNSIHNLVPACVLCNVLASDKVFDSVEDKRTYILSKRSKRQRQHVCTVCGLPFAYREHSPSLFLCAECYDEEYDTQYAQSKSWRDWIKLLRRAEVDVDALRRER